MDVHSSGSGVLDRIDSVCAGGGLASSLAAFSPPSLHLLSLPLAGRFGKWREDGSTALSHGPRLGVVGPGACSDSRLAWAVSGGWWAVETPRTQQGPVALEGLHLDGGPERCRCDLGW